MSLLYKDPKDVKTTCEIKQEDGKTKIDKLSKFCPTHYCYWQNCGCNKPTDKQINRLRHSKI